jgi:hypothetical protein
MRRLIPTSVAGLMLVIGLAFLMFSASAAARPTAAAGATKLIVAMHDPGCHWFYTSGSPDHRMYSKTVVRHGPVKLTNLDDGALIIKGPGGTKHDKIGATLNLKTKGVYKITMVKQMPDDNHLKLTIK